MAAPRTIYSSQAGEDALRQHYAATLASMRPSFPVKIEEMDVNTHFGKTHIIVAGPKEAPPLFAWHGTAAPGPFQLLLFEPFVRSYRVIVADLPCQAGSRSDCIRLDPSHNDLGHWAAAVVRTLGFTPNTDTPILHAGISYGGGVIIDLARVDPGLISAAALLVPSSLHPALGTWRHSLIFLFWFLLPMMVYRLWPAGWTKRLALGSVFDEPDAEHPTLKQQELTFRHIQWFPQRAAQLRSREELQGYTAPTLVIAAKNDVFGGGQATVQRSKEVFPGGAVLETEVVEGGHVPKHETMQSMLRHVREFFESHGFGGRTSSSL